MPQSKTVSIRMQKMLVGISLLLFVIKILAWFITDSVAILTDALESTVNVVAGMIGLYSMILAAKPRDREHPYGHGKVEFISAAIEGTLISVAGLLIIYEALLNLRNPHQLHQLDVGMILMASTGVINYLMALYIERKAEKEHSPILLSGAAHLKLDTYSTIGLLLGVLLIRITGYAPLDSWTAILFALLILKTGYTILRKSISGIMDEHDESLINDIVNVLNEHRKPEWLDVHNMRVINYAGFYHIDCHLTVAYYLNINQAHEILDSLTAILSEHFQERVEFFIHIDGCVPESQCGICRRVDCMARKEAFQEEILWTADNILSNQKHQF